MKIIIRLVGYSILINEENFAYDLTIDADKFNFDIFKNIIITYNILSLEELNNCSLTCNSKNLKKESIEDSSDINYKAFIFTTNNDIKQKLLQIFKKYGKLNPFIEKNMYDAALKKKLSDENENTDSEYEDIEETINVSDHYYNDDDFLHLIRIYKNKPELFNFLYKILSTNEKVSDKINNIDKDKLETINEVLNKIDPQISENNINDIINKTGTNLNLIIRYLILNN